MTKCSQHTKNPPGYCEWHEWAQNKLKTHNQIKCDECGLYKIWLKKDSRTKGDA